MSFSKNVDTLTLNVTNREGLALTILEDIGENIDEYSYARAYRKLVSFRAHGVQPPDRRYQCDPSTMGVKGF